MTSKTATGTPPSRLPEGVRIYAIGDIHGCLDLLSTMHEHIIEDLALRPVARPEIVYVGDYCDRGPDTAGVVARLLAPSGNLPPATHLKGNHEDIWLAFLDDPEVMVNWYRLGGLDTLSSYGVATDQIDRGPALAIARDALLAAMPPAHLRWLRTLPIDYRNGPYFFCHAGVRPGVPLDQQTERDLLWIRYEFLGSDADHGARIVHGHTPSAVPEVLPNRINVDTGAYARGVLTCAVLERDTVRFLEACGSIRPR